MNRYGTAAVTGIRRIGSGERRAASFDRLLLIGTLAALVVTAASFLAHTAWLFELLTHFRFQLAVGAILLSVCALARRRLALMAAAAVACAFNIAPLVPWLLAVPAAEADAATAGIRLMAANVSFRNRDYGALLEQIHETDPDVVGLLEVDQQWIDGLAALESEFDWSMLYPEEGAYGLALYSDVPVREVTPGPYVEGGLQTSISVELEIGGVPTTLVLAHVSAPTTPARARLRNAQFRKIGADLGEDPNAEQILLGDLNTTPWSPYYAELVTLTGLSNAARGFGYHVTWPTGFSLLKIPIDHCLVSDGLHVRSFRTGSDFGSDHLPIIVELSAEHATAASGT